MGRERGQQCERGAVRQSAPARTLRSVFADHPPKNPLSKRIFSLRDTERSLNHARQAPLIAPRPLGLAVLALWDTDHGVAGYPVDAGIAFCAVVAGCADLAFGAVATRGARGTSDAGSTVSAADAGLAGCTCRARSRLGTFSTRCACSTWRTGSIGHHLHDWRRSFALAGREGEGG